MPEKYRPAISVIIPTRERAEYLKDCIKTCTAIKNDGLEVLVLDNASDDNTAAVVASIGDQRVKYFRSGGRLSMRANFERGFQYATGEYICFIGDDDGLLPHAIDEVQRITSNFDVDAVVSLNARYYWPDTPSDRRNCCLIPRGEGIRILSSRESLRKILRDGQYQRIPCMYYGFIKRKLYDRIIQKNGRFFLTNQPDVYSSIALSMENIQYALTKRPLCIAGVSRKSNGGRVAAQAHRGEYIAEWKREDDVGFLPGFDDWVTIGSVIIESALRYCEFNRGTTLTDILNRESIIAALNWEAAARLSSGKDPAGIAAMYRSAAMPISNSELTSRMWGEKIAVFGRHVGTFISAYPCVFDRDAVANVFDASKEISRLISDDRLGYGSGFLRQLVAARRMRAGS